ncbi:MAG: hypothetical protein K2K01_07260 [Eubacterium sp.]|nr:hypothetical protein [Eubacterium sp.]
MNYFKERINKRFFINGFKIIAFVLVVAIILFAISPIFMPKTNKDFRDKSANGILAEPANSIDVIIVGDSESYSTFIPLQIWNDYGITSYVCGTPKQTLAYSTDFLTKAFESQKPKLVVLETNSIFRKFSLGSAVLLRADKWFSIYRYHDRWKKLSVADLTSSEVSRDYIENDKGFRLEDGIDPISDKDYMKPSNDKEKILSQNKTYIKNMMKLCEENGAEFMLVSTPSVKNWNYERHNSVVDLSEELGVDYVDMNLLQEEIPIDWSCETRDAGDHLNYSGAKKATSYFGKYLNSKKMFTDHRKDSRYSEWNAAYSNFMDKAKKASSLKKDSKKA